MKIKPSSALRNDYAAISKLAKVSGEPIFITNKGEDDGVFMSMETYERTQWINDVRAKVEVAEEAIRKGQYEKADVVIARLKEKHGL